MTTLNSIYGKHFSNEIPLKVKHKYDINKEIFNIVKVKKLTENAMIPNKATIGSAGYDLYSAYDVVIPEYGNALVLTDVCIQMPNGVYGRLAARSGMALNDKILVGAGVIDPDYTGNIGVVLFNHSGILVSITKGQKIAQIIFEKILQNVKMIEQSELLQTERGIQGFGSSGK